MTQETEIRKLKKEIKDLRLLCEAAGVPLLIIYFPKLGIGNGKAPSKDVLKWAKEKISEYESKFPKIK